MSTLTSLNAANLMIARGWVSLWVTIPCHRRSWCTIFSRRVVSNRTVVLDEADVLSMRESNVEQRNDDEKEDNIPRTMCSEEPGTPLGESPLRESLQYSWSMEDERDVTHSEETPRPRYNLQSTVSPQQCIPSPKYNILSTRAPGHGWIAGSIVASKSTNIPNI
jgi:hypothetical protein